MCLGTRWRDKRSSTDSESRRSFCLPRIGLAVKLRLFCTFRACVRFEASGLRRREVEDGFASCIVTRNCSVCPNAGGPCGVAVIWPTRGCKIFLLGMLILRTTAALFVSCLSGSLSLPRCVRELELTQHECIRYTGTSILIIAPPFFRYLIPAKERVANHSRIGPVSRQIREIIQRN